MTYVARSLFVCYPYSEANILKEEHPMKKSDGLTVLEQVALKHGVSVEEVRREINLAIEDALLDPTFEVKEYWAKIPKKGEKPTPEEMIEYIANKIKSELSQNNPTNT